MRVQLVGPSSGYVHDGYRSWLADEVIEVDDNDQAAVDWWRTFATAGGGTVLEDVKPPKPAAAEPPKRGRPPLPRDSEGNVVRT